MGTDSNDHLLYSIRNYLLEVSLLGEMITYLGMSMPMAAWSTITWSQNSKKSNGSEVEIQKVKCKTYCRFDDRMYDRYIPFL